MCLLLLLQLQAINHNVSLTNRIWVPWVAVECLAPTVSVLAVLLTMVVATWKLNFYYPDSPLPTLSSAKEKKKPSHRHVSGDHHVSQKPVAPSACCQRESSSPPEHTFHFNVDRRGGINLPYQENALLFATAMNRSDSEDEVEKKETPVCPPLEAAENTSNLKRLRKTWYLRGPTTMNVLDWQFLLGVNT